MKNGNQDVLVLGFGRGDNLSEVDAYRHFISVGSFDRERGMSEQQIEPRYPYRVFVFDHLIDFQDATLAQHVHLVQPPEDFGLFCDLGQQSLQVLCIVQQGTTGTSLADTDFIAAL